VLKAIAFEQAMAAAPSHGNFTKKKGRGGKGEEGLFLALVPPYSQRTARAVSSVTTRGAKRGRERGERGRRGERAANFRSPLHYVSRGRREGGDQLFLCRTFTAGCDDIDELGQR